MRAKQRVREATQVTAPGGVGPGEDQLPGVLWREPSSRMVARSLPPAAGFPLGEDPGSESSKLVWPWVCSGRVVSGRGDVG